MAREDVGAAAAIFRDRANGGEKFQVLILGQRGAGKTAFLRLLQGLDGLADSKLAPRSLTAQINSFARDHAGNLLPTTAATVTEVSPGAAFNVLDVPGWEDTSVAPTDDRNVESAKFLKQAAAEAKYLDAVVLVVNGTTARSQTAIERCLKILGEIYPLEEIRDRVVVLFTFCDSEHKCAYPVQSLRTYLGRENPPLFYLDNPIGRLSGLSTAELEEQLVEDAPDIAGSEIRREVQKGAEAAAGLLRHVSETKKSTRLKGTLMKNELQMVVSLVAFAIFALIYVFFPSALFVIFFVAAIAVFAIFYAQTAQTMEPKWFGICGLVFFTVFYSFYFEIVRSILFVTLCALFSVFAASAPMEKPWHIARGVLAFTIFMIFYVTTPCDVENSKRLLFPACSCKDDYSGSINWGFFTRSGECTIGVCDIEHSNQFPGHDCACSHGYRGRIDWSDGVPSGTCAPGHSLASAEAAAAAAVAEQHREAAAEQHREAAAAAERDREAAAAAAAQHDRSLTCDVEHSNKRHGHECACLDSYTGHIGWSGSTPTGSCTAAACTDASGDIIEHSNRQDGPSCACGDDGYSGHITWLGAVASGACRPAKCDVDNSNNEAGLSCACLPAYNGTVTWSGSTPTGTCTTCKAAYMESDSFFGAMTCVPAACDISNSNGLAGRDCACHNGYEGSIEWSGSNPDGTCTKAPCDVENSNQAAGTPCSCLPGYNGTIIWSGSTPTGTCNNGCLPGYIETDSWFGGITCTLRTHHGPELAFLAQYK